MVVGGSTIFFCDFQHVYLFCSDMYYTTSDTFFSDSNFDLQLTTAIFMMVVGGMTNIILVILQECVTYRTNEENPDENEMDYKSYLDFVLAMENKQVIYKKNTLIFAKQIWLNYINYVCHSGIYLVSV